MAVTMKTKSSPRRRHRTVMLTKGDWLDVMDKEGVWNVARVLSVPSPEEVEVMYDGWPEEYDEVVRVDSDRVAPFHTFTWAVKCWVKYLNWPMWPSVITIRTPGTKAGIENLSREKQLYVDFLDDPNFDKRDRCWQKKKQVKEFRTHYEASRGMSNGPEFENALEWALLSNATTVMPTFSRGTLPLQYNESTTESVKKMRKNMGNDLWYQSFENNCKRHSKTHVYTIPEDVGSEDSSGILSQMNRLEVRRPITSKPEKQSSPRKKKSRSKTLRDNTAVKIEQDLPEEIEVPLVIEQDVSEDIGVPYEPESSERSDDQGEISDGDFNDQSNTTTERSVLLAKRAAHQSKPLMKMAARRSVPPITGYLHLTASPKPRSTRSPPLAFDTDDSEEEEKGTEKVRVGKQNELGPKVTASGRAPNGLTQASGAAELQTSRRRASAREQDPSEDTLEGLPEDMLEDMRGDALEDTSGDTLEERIAYTQSVLRNLEAKRQESINARVLKERRKRVKPSPPTSSAHDISASRSNKNQSSFLQASEKRMSADSRHQGTIKTPLEVGEELKHSFLSIEDAYSSNSQERKRVPAPKDDDVANDEEMSMLDAQSEPKETKRSTRSKSPRFTERKDSADFKQLDDEMSDDQARIDAKCQEVRRPFCVMQAGLEVVLADSSEIDGEQKAQAKPSRKTVIAVPRKFNECVQKAFTSEPPLSPRTAVFNSSEGFSMGKWFKRSIRPKHRSTKHFKMTQ